jgi:uncharacterized membrane protein YkoI
MKRPILVFLALGVFFIFFAGCGKSSRSPTSPTTSSSSTQFSSSSQNSNIEDSSGVEDSSGISDMSDQPVDPSLARITPDQAKAAALAAVSGTVLRITLDDENGQIVYSVEIQTSKGISDVKVDATTGQVIRIDNGQD